MQTRADPPLSIFKEIEMHHIRRRTMVQARQDRMRREMVARANHYVNSVEVDRRSETVSNGRQTIVKDPEF